MNLRYLLLFLFMGCMHQQRTFSQTLYGGVIKVDAKTYNLIKDAIGDMQYQLAKATGNDFKIETTDTSNGSGIRLIKLDAAVNVQYDKRLDASNDDAVLIESDGEHTIRIIAYTRQGLINGIYTYLDTLGFRWYQPGEEWAYAPKLKGVGVKCNAVFAPDFSLRTFFGTWGTPRNRVVDKTGEVDRAWNLWSTRNRLGGIYTLKGHAWGAVLAQWHDYFKDRPEEMALVNGKRVGVDASANKFCISNEDFQKVFVFHMVRQLKKMISDNPSLPVYFVSVEPSDGDGDCECDACKKMGSVSTRDFFLANLVAKEFQKISPKAYVNLYAYNTHATPPDLQLEPNVIVQIIPYGYQNVASPEKLIEAWKKKSDHLFIYDYYGLPILNLDQPLHNVLAPWRFAERLKYWHAQNIKGVTLESSYSIGATGVGLYLFARLGWDIHQDEWRILKEYYHNCYGPAHDVVWLADLALADDSMEKSVVLDKVDKDFGKGVAKLKLQPEEKARIVDYEAYLHYLKLLYKMQKTDVQGDTVAVDNLLRYVYSIFMRKEVHPFPVNEWPINFGHTAAFVKKNWSTFNINAPGMKFATVVPLTDAEIEKLFEDDCRDLR